MSTTIADNTKRHTQPSGRRAVQRARAAERMRKSRAMRRKGLRFIPFQLYNAEITALVDLGFLDPDQQRDPRAIARALGNLIDACGLRPR